MDLAAWYGPHLAPAATRWLATVLASPASLRSTAIAIGHAPRRTGTTPLPDPAADWPRGWRVDQAVRVDLARRLGARDLDALFATGDAEELVALYQGLALLPSATAARAAEGVRSNLVTVFRAVALDNPYPAEHLDDGAFNQVVLKAVFTSSDLDRIRGLRARWNPDLQRMLADLVRERTAARRPIDPRVLTLLG